jgi:alcohol dehydrogenase
MSQFGSLRTPRNLVVGAGQRGALPQFARALGQRALVVTDQRLARDKELLALVESMRQAGVVTEVFAGTLPELPASCIEEGMEAARAFKPEMVVGIGGGSCMDAAKVIALILTHGGEPTDYYGEFKVPGPVLPVIALPTTAGTGSEVTPVVVIADPARSVKVGIASPHLIPHTAICDPEFTYSCPPSLTAISGADALTHAVEAFTTARRTDTPSLVHEHVFLGKNTLTDHYALLAISHISAGLKTAYDNGEDLVARERLMLGATAAGLAFGTAGTAAAHAIQYPVGALTHTAHGAGVAVMLPYVMAFNRSHANAEMAEIGQAMGLRSDGLSLDERARAAIEAVAELLASVGIPRTLADLGVTEDQLPFIVEQALGAVRLVKNNPRPLDLASMTALVQAAFEGDRQRLDA